jgi:hypothetical protein
MKRLPLVVDPADMVLRLTRIRNASLTFLPITWKSGCRAWDGFGNPSAVRPLFLAAELLGQERNQCFFLPLDAGTPPSPQLWVLLLVNIAS